MRKNKGRKSGLLFVTVFGLFMFECGLAQGSSLPGRESDLSGFDNYQGPVINGLTLQDLENMEPRFIIPVWIVSFDVFPPYVIPEQKGLIPRLNFSPPPPIFWQRARISVLSVTLNLGFHAKVYYEQTMEDLFRRVPPLAPFVDLFPSPMQSPYRIPSITPYRPPEDFVDNGLKGIYLPASLYFKPPRIFSWLEREGSLKPTPSGQPPLDLLPSPKVPPTCPHTERGTAPMMDPTKEGAFSGPRFLNACPQESR